MLLAGSRYQKCHDSGTLPKTKVYIDLGYRYRYLPRLALLRSTVPEGSVWNRLTNFLVSRPRDVSYLVFSRGDLNTHQDIKFKELSHDNR